MTFTKEFQPSNHQIIGDGQAYFSRRYTTASNIGTSSVSVERFISEADEYANGPFDTLFVDNTDAVDLAIRLDLNPDNKIPVTSGKTIAVKGLNFRNFTIENLDGSTEHTAGAVEILVMNTRTPRRD